MNRTMHNTPAMVELQEGDCALVLRGTSELQIYTRPTHTHDQASTGLELILFTLASGEVDPKLLTNPRVPGDLRSLIEDTRGPYAEELIWGNSEAAAFFGYTEQTWNKDRSLARGPAAKVPYTKRAGKLAYRPADCARVDRELERGNSDD